MFGSVFASFAVRLAFGSIWFLTPVPVKETGRGFPRLIALIAFSFLVIAALGRPAAPGGRLTSPTGMLLFLSLGLSLLASVLIPVLPDRAAKGLTLAIAVVGLGYFFSLPGAEHRSDGITGALLLGSVVTSMVLGHWYLVSKGLRVRHLVVLTGCFIGATLLRAAHVGLFVLPRARTGWSAAEIVTGDGLFLILWVGIGIALPFITGILAFRTARIGSTQSATGLLYVAIVLVLIGELIASYLGAHGGAFLSA